MSDVPPEIGRIEVPIIVRICETTMTVREVLAMTPGSIIELPTQAEDQLDLLVGNRKIGTGRAVKVGERFGISVRSIGSMVSDRVEEEIWDDGADFDPEAFADALLAAQD